MAETYAQLTNQQIFNNFPLEKEMLAEATWDDYIFAK